MKSRVDSISCRRVFFPTHVGEGRATRVPICLKDNDSVSVPAPSSHSRVSLERLYRRAGGRVSLGPLERKFFASTGQDHSSRQRWISTLAGVLAFMCGMAHSAFAGLQVGTSGNRIWATVSVGPIVSQWCCTGAEVNPDPDVPGVGPGCHWGASASSPFLAAQ